MVLLAATGAFSFPFRESFTSFLTISFLPFFPLARSGSPLPAAPVLTHRIKNPRKQFSHDLLEGNEKQFQRDPAADGALSSLFLSLLLHRANSSSLVVALHASTTVFEALSDLPSFDNKNCFQTVKKIDKKGNVVKDENGKVVTYELYTSKLSGPTWGPNESPAYGSTPKNSLQLRHRLQRSTTPSGTIQYISSGLTHHVTPPIAEITAQRVRRIGKTGKKMGNYEGSSLSLFLHTLPFLHFSLSSTLADLDGTPFYPKIPRWLSKKSAAKNELWWAKYKRNQRSSPLRTTLGLDGASQGPRMHYDQARSISVREYLRLQGVPDWIEVLCVPSPFSVLFTTLDTLDKYGRCRSYPTRN
jgi:hypothetical protein